MKKELSLKGMSCGHCVMAVKEALSTVKGVQTESVEIGRAIINVADFSSVQAELESVLEEEGYPVESVKAA